MEKVYNVKIYLIFGMYFLCKYTSVIHLSRLRTRTSP